jgi:hypothetical protein
MAMAAWSFRPVPRKIALNEQAPCYGMVDRLYGTGIGFVIAYEMITSVAFGKQGARNLRTGDSR